MLKYLIWKFTVRLRAQVLYNLHRAKRMLTGSAHVNGITILPHEGLGDLIAILPALQEIAKKGIKINLIVDVRKWMQLENAFINVPKLNVINYVANEFYKMPKFVKQLDECPLIALGFYSNIPIVDYPNSFYWQLEVNTKIASKFIEPKLREINLSLPLNYDFIDLNTSKGLLSNETFQHETSTVTSISNTELLLNHFGSHERITIDAETSFQMKICIALKANKVICSDAALFNALVRIERRPKLIVYSRNHLHSHSAAIYQYCKFDGKVYEFPSCG